ncbi:MAG: fused response regulator/phosphatase [Pseudomonadota bacterium]
MEDQKPGSGRRVLVVDDSRTHRLMLSSRLRRWGYDVLEAEDGVAALEIIDRDPVNLVISDWMMPRMDGPALCRALRERTDDTYIYVVLLTSRQERTAVTDGLNAGADDFLQKPSNVSELAARLAAADRLVTTQERLREQKRVTSKAYEQIKNLYDRIEADLLAAAALQAEFIPAPLAEVNGCQIAADCRFAGHVGGDVVGYFPIGRHSVGLYSIDVAGHGVASSLLAIRLGQLFSMHDTGESIAFETAPEGGLRARAPEDVVAELNRRHLINDEHSVYFTIAYAVLDLRDGTARLCQAGHSPAAVIGVDGSVRFAEEGTSPPVGLLDDAEFETEVLQVAPGERLVLYSDGITEAETGSQAGEMLGSEGFAEILETLVEVPMPGLLPKLMGEVVGRTSGRPFEDDVSVIVAERPLHTGGLRLVG